MFFGEVIKRQDSFQIPTFQNNQKALQLTNAVLDVASCQAQLYLRAKNKDILLARLNPNTLQSNLNVLIDLQEKPCLIAKNGNVHVCGHFTQKVEPQNQNPKLVSDTIINTNKKINDLANKYIKQVKQVPAQKESEKENSKQSFQTNKQKQKTPLIEQPTRRSSRFSSRPAISVSQVKQRKQNLQISPVTLKKDIKIEKKNQKQEKLLKNGRYSLKALLENIDDSDEDSDEQFQNSGQDDESDDDSQFQDDEAEGDQEVPQESKLNKNIKRSRSQDQVTSKQKSEKETKNNKEQEQRDSTNLIVLQTNKKPQIQIAQQEDSDNRKQINPQQYQEKWPENTESELQKEANQREKKISQIAAKMKCPTKKPTI